jgi:hypothetical protein
MTAAAAAGGCTGMAAGAAAPAAAAGGFLEFRRRFARRIRLAVGDDGFALRCLLADFGAPVFEPDLQGRVTHETFYQCKPFLPLKIHRTKPAAVFEPDLQSRATHGKFDPE